MDPASPAAPPPPPRWRARLALLGPLGWVLAWFGLVIGTAVGTAVWLLRSETGTQWLLPRLPGIEVEGFRGALLGERFAFERLVVRWSGGQASVTVLGVEAEGVRWHWRPSPAHWVAVQAERVTAREVVVATGPSTPGPVEVPTSIGIPLRVEVGQARLGLLRIDALAPFTDISAQVTIGDGPSASYRARGVRIGWDRLHAEGDAELGTRAPLELKIDAIVTPRHAGDAPPWTAVVRTRGPLTRFEVDAALRGAAHDGGAAPSADLHATIASFEPWPVAALRAQTTALDLATLSSAAPETRLDGRVDIRTRASDAPAEATASFVNTRPGRWNEGRLPVRRLELEARGRLDRLDRVEWTALDAEVGGGGGPAGRVQGDGAWEGDNLALALRLADVRPQQLDGRAAAMTLGGPLALELRGLPALPGATTTPRPVTLALRAALEGRLDAAPQPVALEAQAELAADRIEVGRLRARSGSAQADLQARAERGRGGWQIASDGSVSQFDPVVWWPGEAGSAWRQGPHRLSARWQLDLRLPADAASQPPLTLLQRLAGTGQLRVADSVLAGVPLALDLTLAQDPAQAATPSTVRADLALGQNHLLVDGRANPAGDGAADRWQLSLRADALPTLAPVARLHPALASWLPRAGRASATATVRGRWPAVATEGELSADRLQAGELAIDSARARWTLDTATDQPLALQAEASRLRLGRQAVDRLRADLQGTPSDHRVEMSLALPVVPPPLVEQLFGLRAQAGTRALLQGAGSWRRDSTGGGTWSGRIARLAAGAWDGRSVDGPAGGDWLDARDLRADVHLAPEGGIDRITAAAGSARLADAVALRWDEVLADFSTTPARLRLKAEVQPFAVAPLLARWQPTLGWNGDLQLAARVDIAAAERFAAEIAVERTAGDLRLTDDTGTQALGLEAASLRFSAQEGVWTVAQAFAGRALGEMAGAVRIRTTPERRWPGADAPMEGVLQARVANLGVWGAWVPPGWRLAGELETTAEIGGRFGAPEYTGGLRGRGIGVRNLLLGVNVRDGEVDVKLEGPSARIERFIARAGDGQVTLAGGASFGERPAARLTLEADRLRVLGRIDRQLVVSGRGAFEFSPDEARLDGSLKVDEGLFDFTRADAPSLDDDVNVRRDASAPAPTAPEPRAAPRRPLRMTVDVDLGERLRLRGRGLETALRGQLRLTSPNNRLAVEGTVRTESGTYAAYGQKLEIERGIVAFSGAPDNPRLDILALRPNLDVRVGVSIAGTLQLPRVRLYSEPEMGETDKLSWLVLGREPEGLGRTDTALLQRAAVALLAGEGEAPTDQLMRAIGLDELSFRQSEGEVRETVVALGKQLSRRWYVGYERSVNAATGTWQLIYRIAQRFTLRAQAGDDSSLDLIWVWRRDEPQLLPMPQSRSAAPP